MRRMGAGAGFLRSWGFHRPGQKRGDAVNLALPAFGIGSVIAVIVLVLAIVLMVVGQLDLKVGCLIAALAIARLT